MHLGTGRYIHLPGISHVEYEGMRFIIMNAPKATTATTFAQTLADEKVTDVVRVCESTYDTKEFLSRNMKVHNLEFNDGSPPPPEVLTKWLQLLKDTFFEADGSVKTSGLIAVHCLAGLGRAPVLVAIALMERGMTNEQAILLIRQKRRGAFNQPQLDYLTQYKSKNQLKPSKYRALQHLFRFCM